MCLFSDNFRIVEKTQFTDLQGFKKNFWTRIKNRRNLIFFQNTLLFLFDLETLSIERCDSVLCFF